MADNGIRSGVVRALRQGLLLVHLDVEIVNDNGAVVHVLKLSEKWQTSDANASEKHTLEKCV